MKPPSKPEQLNLFDDTIPEDVVTHKARWRRRREMLPLLAWGRIVRCDHRLRELSPKYAAQFESLKMPTARWWE